MFYYFPPHDMKRVNIMKIGIGCEEKHELIKPKYLLPKYSMEKTEEANNQDKQMRKYFL